MKWSPTYDTVNEQVQRNGCGVIDNFIPATSIPKGAQFSIDLTKWERYLLNLMLGGTIFTVSAHAGGAIRGPFASDGQPLPVCIEFWIEAWDATSQAVTAISTPNSSYHHIVLPFVRCSIPTDVTTGNAPGIVTVAGVGNENPAITANGPWNDWPAGIAGGGGFTSAWGEYDDGTIPTASCGLQAVPSGS